MDHLEIGAGGALHPILKRERVQGVYHSFSACALPHFDRETPKPNPFQLTLRDIFARMRHGMISLILCWGGVTMLTKLSTQKRWLLKGRALYRLSIVFLIATLLGCGTRSGGYSEFGPSFEHSSSSEEWSIYNGMPNYRLDSLSLVCYHPFAGNSTRCPVGGYGRHRTRSHEQSGYLVPFPVNTSCKEAKWT